MAAGNIPDKFQFVDFGPAPGPGQIVSAVRYGLDVAIANDGGKLYAVSNRAPPTSQPLSLGKIVDGCITDPTFGTKFDLKTGAVVGTFCPAFFGIFGKLFAPKDIAAFQAKASGDNVQVNVNVNARAQFEQNYWVGILDAQGKATGGYY